MIRIPSLTGATAALLLATPTAVVAAQTPAAISNIRYEVTFDRAHAADRRLGVATTFDVAGDGPVLLSLPAWTPGAYEISNFARWVIGFRADGGGRDLAWDKVDFDTWRVFPAGARSVTIRFDYQADSLDNAMAWTQPEFALFNGTNVFMYPEGRPLAYTSQVTVRTETGWRVVTGMPSVASAPNTFTATNYHDLVDMPFFVGRLDVDSAQVSGKWIRLATYPAGSMAGAARETAWEQIKRMIPPEVAVFGEAPFANYTIMQIADSAYGGASGLEHQSSHVDVVTPLAIGSEFLPSLYAHEIFHAWNVKRLRPVDLWPYVYDRPMPTPWLWVSEGITDYYADLALVRGGVVDERGFLDATASKINEVASSPAVSLEDASLSTWVHPVDGTGYLYYPKGSLAGLVLDIMIRDASDNHHSLDDVMRELYQADYKNGRGFTGEEWWAAVSRAANGRSFTQFAERYVNGREPWPWDEVLPLAGLKAERGRVPRLGVFTQADANGIRVSQVDPAGAAAAAGVQVGDYLVAVGDIDVSDAAFGDRFRAKFGSAVEGDPLAIRVRRGSETLTLNARLRFAPGDARLVPSADASAKAVRIRNGIMHGTVDR